MLSREVLSFVLGELPAGPARVLEVGAGAGELAAALRQAGCDVLAIDPGGEPPVVSAALNDVKEPEGASTARSRSCRFTMWSRSKNRSRTSRASCVRAERLQWTSSTPGRSTSARGLVDRAAARAWGARA